jgi:hypothetical protein
MLFVFGTGFVLLTLTVNRCGPETSGDADDSRSCFIWPDHPRTRQRFKSLLSGRGVLNFLQVFGRVLVEIPLKNLFPRDFNSTGVIPVQPFGGAMKRCQK